MLNLYITSSSRKCGKSFITTGLAATMQSLGYSTSVYKPIQTSGIENNGFTQSPDLTYIKSVDPYINTHFSYLFKNEFEPIISAELEEECIDLDYINSEYKKISSSAECTLVDGDGGLLSPIAPETQNIDLITKLNLPTLIITSPSENAINDTLMTIFAGLEKKIDIRGVVINNIKNDCSKELLKSIPRIIEEYTNINVVGLVNHIENKISPEDLITSVLNGIDIESIFNVKIEKLDIE